jgi:hypothetical protein
MATITMRITPHINTFTKYVIGISTDLPGIGGTGIMIVIGGIRVVDGGITATFEQFCHHNICLSFRLSPSNKLNIVMVSRLASSAVDRGFKS